MAKKQQDDDLLMDDELTAAFLGDDQDQPAPADDNQTQQQDDWLDEDNMPGQLAVDVYDTKDTVYVQAPIAGVNKDDLDVSISDNTLSIHGSRSGNAPEGANFYLQECFWGEFARSLTLPVAVKEDEIEAVLKDGVLTISFKKINDAPKKIQIK